MQNKIFIHLKIIQARREEMVKNLELNKCHSIYVYQILLILFKAFLRFQVISTNLLYRKLVSFIGVFSLKAYLVLVKCDKSVQPMEEFLHQFLTQHYSIATSAKRIYCFKQKPMKNFNR